MQHRSPAGYEFCVSQVFLEDTTILKHTLSPRGKNGVPGGEDEDGVDGGWQTVLAMGTKGGKLTAHRIHQLKVIGVDNGILMRSRGSIRLMGSRRDLRREARK